MGLAKFVIWPSEQKLSSHRLLNRVTHVFRCKQSTRSSLQSIWYKQTSTLLGIQIILYMTKCINKHHFLSPCQFDIWFFLRFGQFREGCIICKCVSHERANFTIILLPCWNSSTELPHLWRTPLERYVNSLVGIRIVLLWIYNLSSWVGSLRAGEMFTQVNKWNDNR